MPVFSIDFETRSLVDLKTAGAHKYASHPSTQVICMGWRKDNAVPELWRAGVLEERADPFPEELIHHVLNGGRLIAHNAAFEYLIWNRVLLRQFPRLGNAVMPISKWYCTMAAALACGLPAGLDQLARAIGVNVSKDMDGHRAMMRLCKPKAYAEDGTPEWDERVELREKLYKYCKLDVAVERAVGQHIPFLSPEEQNIWRIDQESNERGVGADMVFCHAAIPVLELAKKEADREITRLTAGNVTATTQTAKIVDWIRSKGLECESIAKGEVEELKLDAGLFGHQDVVDALVVRMNANKASTAKYKAFISGADENGTLRGLLQYHAASTGRWGGRRVQPQNFVRIDFDEEQPNLDFTLKVVSDPNLAPKAKVAALNLGLGQSAFYAMSRALRPTFIARPGTKFIGGDWSNIEGRVNAWLAGEEWLLHAFREFDAGRGADLYKITAGNILGKEPDQITKSERQIYGKTSSLACGYQGGKRAFVSMGVNLGSKVTEDEAVDIVKGWREAHPKIVQNWYDTQEAAIKAVQNPGRVFTCSGGKISYHCKPNWLVCRLPSGRELHYRKPYIEMKETPWGELREALFAWSVNSFTKKYEPSSLYGGLLVENNCQAISACILRDTMVELDRLGIPLVLTVHDEVVLETPMFTEFTPDDLKALMCRELPWSKGLPLAAECWEGPRYGK